MINIENYISQLVNLLQRQYNSRLLYIGLQGSYLRGEAMDNRNVDIMVVIDGLSVYNPDYYRDIVLSLNGHAVLFAAKQILQIGTLLKYVIY